METAASDRESEMASTRSTTLLPEGTKVVELGESVATAVCGRHLEWLGADVTRVRITGTGSSLEELGPRIGKGVHQRSALAAWLEHDKTLIEIDGGTADVRDELDDALLDADVILIAGTTTNWDSVGISVTRIRERAPRAVIGQITAWGNTGPSSSLRGGELVAQAAGGLMKLVGRADREPVRLGGFPMQAATGLLALDGVLIGLFRRQNTGQGASFETSEFESVAHLEWKISSAVQAGRPRERRGNEGGGPVVVPTRDGHFGCFFIPKNWPEVKELLDDPRLEDERFSTPKSRAQNEQEYTLIVAEATRDQGKRDLYHRAQAREIPAGHVATMSDLLTSPQYRARNFFQSINIAGVGQGSIPGAPWQVLTTDDLEPEGIPA
jgi:crotonobetainyl-CoA:carnitine CoA-transferase CaiB-like acyl-CoA transferase